MQRIMARELLNYSTTELWDTLVGEFILIFDDGVELAVDARSTIYSSYAWDFHRQYAVAPLLAKHHVKDILGNKRLNSGTHLELLGNAMWSVYDGLICSDTNGTIDETALRDQLSEKIYRLTNIMYNDLSYRLEEDVVSLDITDFIEVLDQIDITTANDNIQSMDVMNTPRAVMEERIDDTYKVITKILLDGIALPNNPISLASRSKIVSMGQVVQCIGPRGFLTDVDSNVFPVPITRGYCQGLRSFHDSFIESRSSAKSLVFSKSPLQDSEYFSRRLQLMAEIVRNLHHTDCGSTIYAPWTVRGDVVENNKVVASGDLYQLLGKNYMDNDGILKTIGVDDKHLIGKTLRLRSVIHCQHPDPYGFCSTCFGELALSVPANTNIGQMCCTSFAQKTSQSVLSVKHQDGSSVVDAIILDTFRKKYLKVAPDTNSYLLSEDLKGKNAQLIIHAEKATNITDIMDVDDIRKLNITNVFELNDIGIMTGDVPNIEIVDVSISLGRRLASMTYAGLDYIRTHGFNINDQGNYVIDLYDWNWEVPIFTLPLKHINMSDHSRDIAELLESSVGKMHERDKTVSPDAVLVELFNLVNDKLTVNLAVLEVVMYSAMIISAEENDYSLPKPWTNSGLGVMALSMTNRSLSATMAFEYHRDNIVDPSNYINTNRPDHPMDGLLMPYELFHQNR